MSFYETYELLELDRDDGVKTFQAREIATGRPVKVHLFAAPGSPYQAQLLRKLDQLPETERARILDRGNHLGTRYVVTDRLIDYPGLFEWISASLKKANGKTPLESAGAWKVPPAAQAPAPAADSSTPPPLSGPASPPASSSNSDLNREFADLFKTTERPVFVLPSDQDATVIMTPGPVLAAPNPNPPAAAGVPSEPAPKPEEPGQFTRMFQAPPSAPSEFTQMFEAPGVASPSRAEGKPVPDPSTPQPGEFTRMFQSPAGSTPVPAQPTRAKSEPGEFTRMFQSPSSPASGQRLQPSPPKPTPAAGPATAPSGGPGEFTKFFQAQSPAGPLPQSPVVRQPLTPQNPGAGPHGAGEFTRMFGKDELPATAQNPAPNPPVNSAAPNTLPPQAVAPVAATQAFSAPVELPVAGSSSTLPSRQASPSGPGEYTRMFSAPAPMTLGQTATGNAAAGQPASPPPAASTAKNSLTLILGLVGIVILALLIVAFFLLRPH